MMINHRDLYKLCTSKNHRFNSTDTITRWWAAGLLYGFSWLKNNYQHTRETTDISGEKQKGKKKLIKSYNKNL
jgi:hypothetical protein